MFTDARELPDHSEIQADLAIIDSPSLNHWLYHFQGNACRTVLKRGRRVGEGLRE